MSKSKRYYALMLIVVIAFILYVAYVQIIQDPQASAFLGFKTDLNHPLNPKLWLIVMRIHAGLACLAMICGAVNFADRIRIRHVKFHRFNGYLYVICVMLVGLTSGYMAPVATGGRSVSIAFNLLTMLWPAFTVIAVIQIRKKQMASHRKWMVRSYAFCFTNLVVHVLTCTIRTLAGSPYPVSYRISVFITIPLLLLIAELVIRTAWPGPAGPRRSAGNNKP
ncbi:hypothetical protein BGX30_002186 [Mortierella sp. GBA39]|nr:hypothetical protein BGX30_002186 [Mortierella sp. GBA39]